MKFPYSYWLFSLVVVTSPVHAVIVTGNFNANNQEAGLISFLQNTSNPSFAYWDNMVRVSDASGIYLGMNASTGHGWVLSAAHVFSAEDITVEGQSYPVVSSHQIGQSDLKLYEISGSMPNLPTVPLADVGADVGAIVLMIGRGYTTSTGPNYTWNTPGTSDANGMHWGINTISLASNLNIGTTQTPNIQPYLITQFTNPGANQNSYEGTASLGDSGGGMFIYHNGWQLAGIAHFVADGTVGDNVINPSQYGDYSAYSDVFSRTNAITSITGTLIPETSAATMILCGASILLRRKRNR